MSATVVKICGLKTVEHAQIASRHGATMIGLVFAASRRQIGVAEAVAITGGPYKQRPRFVGVFANEEQETVRRLYKRTALDLVQLSGDETPAYCAALELAYIKVLHVRDGETAETLARRARLYEDAEAILIDRGGDGPTRWGGGGKRVDLGVAARAAALIERPMILAGGLDPSNVVEALDAVGPWGVDASSGLETDGEKDSEKIVEFIAAVNRHAPMCRHREG